MNQPHSARPDPKERHALYEADQTLRDTNAVFHVLDALEPPAGKQRLLQGGLIFLAGTFLLVAVGLLLSRYQEEKRPRQEQVIHEVSAKDTAEKSSEKTGGEKGEGVAATAPDGAAANMAAPGFGDLDMSGTSAFHQSLALNTAQPPATEVSPAPASSYAPGKENVHRNVIDPQRAAAQQLARKPAVKTVKPHEVSRLRDRNLRASQSGQRPTRIAMKRSASASEKARSKDTDVDLIAALLSRVPNKQGQTNGSDRTADTATRMSSRAREANPGLGASGANSDVVIRTQGDTTESLVKRCGTLGLIEGHLCRARICSGLWGRDAACPISNAANSH
ncbi:hypothetical protein [Noviherbaspirillum aerium]|uniref:hypothetical protein n=1 Tax=Noviherbaspirillum aerium TaxID=2588497 RepID=UPI00124DEE56|nr:hypothetical protein [Noviherbaspirillum aerium]